ncbi:hypothetical protein ABBQ38_014792 [Trebouxia sp. C0009 RCD-2024]
MLPAVALGPYAELEPTAGTVVLSVCASVTSPVWAPRWRLKAAKALWRKTTVVGTVRRLFCQGCLLLWLQAQCLWLAGAVTSIFIVVAAVTNPVMNLSKIQAIGADGETCV